MYGEGDGYDEGVFLLFVGLGGWLLEASEVDEEGRRKRGKY